MTLENMASVNVSHRGTGITFRSADRGELEAIRECFGYFWSVSDRLLDTQWQVESHCVESVDAIARPDQLSRSAGVFKDENCPCFVEGDSHYYYFAMQGKKCLIHFDVGNRITRFYHEGPITEYSYIRNLVREPALAKYKEAGHITMHASSCAIDGRGILMPGLKGAGKSTLLTHLIESGADFVANDAVLCNTSAPGRITLTSFPQCVRLSVETIENSPILSAYFSRPHSHQFILKKAEFLPTVFDGLFGTHHLQFNAELTLILIPSLDLSRTDYSFEPGDPEVDLAILDESMFYPCHNYIWSPFFEQLNDPEIDVRNLGRVFSAPPMVVRLRYGILDAATRERMFEDLSRIVAEPAA
jgi:hypothetical protein